MPALKTTAIRCARPLATRPSRFAGASLSLDYFLNRQKAMSLYRSFIRVSKGLGDAQTRRETVSWVRRDFENGMPLLADQEKARTFFASASRQLKQMSSANMLVGTQGDKFRGPIQR